MVQELENCPTEERKRRPIYRLSSKVYLIPTLKPCEVSSSYVSKEPKVQSGEVTHPGAQATKW